MDVVSPRYSFQSPFPGDRAAEPRGTKVRGLSSPPLEGDPSLAQTPDCGVAQAEGVSSELGPAAEAEAFIHSHKLIIGPYSVLTYNNPELQSKHESSKHLSK